MKHILAIPAAGKGSRLGAEVPKIFTPIGEGKTVFDFIIGSLSKEIDQIILLLSPEGKSYFDAHLKAKAPQHVTVLIQEVATGMFDAVNQLVSFVMAMPDDVQLILQWGDQPFCDASLHEHMFQDLDSYDASVPLVWVENPYVQYQFANDSLQVFEQREGEPVDAHGFKDMGIFGFRKSLLQATWSKYEQQASPGNVTGEKNFVKYIGTLHPDFKVYWRLDQPYYKSIGINTPEELAEATLFVKQQQAAGL